MGGGGRFRGTKDQNSTRNLYGKQPETVPRRQFKQHRQRLFDCQSCDPRRRFKDILIFFGIMPDWQKSGCETKDPKLSYRHGQPVRLFVMSEFNCQNCGATLSPRFKFAKMVTCDYCGTTNALFDDGFHNIGKAGTMLDAPSLVHLDQPLFVDHVQLTPVGHARFDYGRGWWDEYWCMNEGDGIWLSVDEGDYALETELPRKNWPRKFTPKLGATATLRDEPFHVTEAESATCIAVNGSFPEVLEPGETHLYFDLSGRDGGLATFEKWDGGSTWFIGQWIDPWKVRPA